MFEAMERHKRQVARMEAEQRLAESRRIGPVPDISASLQRILSPGFPSVKLVPERPPALMAKDGRWRDILSLPGIILILGSRGSGKSALAYRLLEPMRNIFTPYVVGMPASARRLLPEWIGMTPSIQDLPRRCIALVDEAYLSFHSRSSLAQESKEMSQAIKQLGRKQPAVGS